MQHWQSHCPCRSVQKLHSRRQKWQIPPKKMPHMYHQFYQNHLHYKTTTTQHNTTPTKYLQDHHTIKKSRPSNTPTRERCQCVQDPSLQHHLHSKHLFLEDHSHPTGMTSSELKSTLPTCNLSMALIPNLQPVNQTHQSYKTSLKPFKLSRVPLKTLILTQNLPSSYQAAVNPTGMTAAQKVIVTTLPSPQPAAWN